MAAPGTLNQAFVEIGFNQNAANILTDPAQESMTLDKLQRYNEKRVKLVCASLRKPGGLIAGAPAPGADPNAPVPMLINPGVYVSTDAEMNLASACYMARHMTRTSRTLVAEDLTEDRVVRYATYQEAEIAYKDPDDKLKLTKPDQDKIFEFIDDWPESLALCTGENGRPLSYILRGSVAIPVGNDPGFGEPGTVYGSMRDEIASRASHAAPQYQLDNAKVFDLLAEAVNDHKHVKLQIKKFTKTKDGRGAWLNFTKHYRGANEIEAMEAAAEKQLETLVYRGEKQRYNFETHVSKHIKAHLDIAKATGTEVPENTKVRKLLASLQHATMSVGVATIRAQDDLRGDFDASVNYLRAFIIANDVGETRTISEFKSDKFNANKKRKGDNDRGGRGGNKKKQVTWKGLDRFYPPKEWWALPQTERDAVLKARSNRQVSATHSESVESGKTGETPLKPSIKTSQRTKE